jgi:hypothetical protein
MYKPRLIVPHQVLRSLCAEEHASSVVSVIRRSTINELVSAAGTKNNSNCDDAAPGPTNSRGTLGRSNGHRY